MFNYYINILIIHKYHLFFKIALLSLSTTYPYFFAVIYFRKPGTLPLMSIHTIYIPLVVFSFFSYKT